MATEKVWVLVECVSMFRMRYMVEAPADHPEWALDTVTMNEAKEFSQEHIGETIVSHRVLNSTAEALVQCDIDNDYCSSWDDDKKVENFFTSMEEQGYGPDEENWPFPIERPEEGTTDEEWANAHYEHDVYPTKCPVCKIEASEMEGHRCYDKQCGLGKNNE